MSEEEELGTAPFFESTVAFLVEENAVDAMGPVRVQCQSLADVAPSNGVGTNL